ncbi:hypothetical protein V6N13_105133 [Hibiscus sabdariffa]
MSSARIDPAEADLGSQKEGLCPASDSRNNSESTVRRPGKAPEGAVPSPSPGRHAATALAAGAARAVRRQPTGSGLGPPVPSPQSQSFSRGYGSILPTSLAYIVPSTRGCSPWRPDAVMSTTGRGRHSVPPDFQGPPGAHRTPRDAVKQKKITLPEAPADVSGLPNVCRQPPRPGSGIFNPIPFEARAKRAIGRASPRLLGSTNPMCKCRFTWNLSPLRLQSSHLIFATTTKICTDGRSARAHAPGFTATAAPLLLIGAWPLAPTAGYRSRA